jgi:hypothetical protein
VWQAVVAWQVVLRQICVDWRFEGVVPAVSPNEDVGRLDPIS